MGLWGNSKEEAVYYALEAEGEGEIRFDKNELLPLADIRFWSITVYDENYYSLKNEFDSYVLTTDQMVFDEDGSIIIRFSSKKGEQNWLYTPGDKIEQSILIHLRHNYLITDWLSSFVFFQTSQDPFRRIMCRNLFSGGLRFEIFANDFSEFAIGTGLIHEMEMLSVDIGFVDPISGVSKDNRLRYELSASITIKKSEHISFSFRGGYRPQIKEIKLTRSFAVARADIKIWKALKVFLAYRFEHDNNPYWDVEKLDSSLRVDLRIKW